MKEEISMPEFLPLFLKFATDIQNDIRSLKEELSDQVSSLRIEMNQRFDYNETRLNKIEATMIERNDFNHLFRSLITTLSKKEILEETEAKYFFSQTQN